VSESERQRGTSVAIVCMSFIRCSRTINPILRSSDNTTVFACKSNQQAQERSVSSFHLRYAVHRTRWRVATVTTEMAGVSTFYYRSPCNATRSAVQVKMTLIISITRTGPLRTLMSSIAATFILHDDNDQRRQSYQHNKNNATGYE